MTENLKKAFAKAFFGVGTLKVISLGLGFLTSIIIARNLGPEGYGKYALVTSIISLLALPLYAGMPALLVRETVKLRLDQKWGLFLGLRRRVSQTIWVGTALLLIAIMLVWYQAGAPVDQSTTFLVLLALPLAPLMALNGTRSAVLRGFKKLVPSQVPESLVQPAVHLAILIGLVSFSTLTVQSSLFSLMLGIFSAFLLGQWLLSKEISSYNISDKPTYETKKWVKSLAPFTAIAAIYIVNNQLATVILGWFSMPDQIGYLRVADRVAQLILLSLTVVNLISAPQIAQYAKSGDYQKLEQVARHSVRIALALAFPISIFLIIMGKPIIGLSFGDAFREPVWLPLAILCIGQLCNVYFGSVGTVLNMSGYERNTLIGVGIGLTVNFILSLLLIPIYGAVGAATAISSGVIVWNVYLAYCVKVRLSIRTTPF